MPDLDKRSGEAEELRAREEKRRSLLNTLERMINVHRQAYDGFLVESIHTPTGKAVFVVRAGGSSFVNRNEFIEFSGNLGRVVGANDFRFDLHDVARIEGAKTVVELVLRNEDRIRIQCVSDQARMKIEGVLREIVDSR